jgi:hypothetical protein
MMRAMLHIDTVPLSSKMVVTFVDGAPPGPGVMADQYTVDNQDAEYQLLTQAIDRFIRVKELERAALAAEVDDDVHA